MSVENQWLEDVFPTEIVPFRGHVSFGGCTQGFQGVAGLNPTRWDESKQKTIKKKNIGNLLSKDPGRKFAKLQFLESY